MEWQYLFRDVILGRGRSYYFEGRVEVKKLEPNRITAEVQGSQDYSVEVEFSNNRIAGIYCSCPHAADDNYCKHMAAVLFEFDDHVRAIEVKHLNLEAEKYVNKADEKIVRKLLIQLLQDDHDLLKSFITALGAPISTIDMRQFKHELYDIFSDYLYPDDFVHYEDAWGLYSDLAEFMERIIKNLLIENAYFEEAFDLTKEVFIRLISLEIDDSDGTTTNIAEACVKIWANIIEKADEEFKKELFEQFQQMLETMDLDYLADYIEAILYDHFKEDNFTDRKRSFAKQQLSYYKENPSLFVGSYSIGKWGLRYLTLLTDEAEIIEFSEKYIEYNDIRTFYVEFLISGGKIQEAIQVLEDSQKREESPNHITITSYEKLKNLYLEVADKDKYLKELFALVSYHGYTRKDLFEEYKGHFSTSDWPNERALLVEKISLSKGLDEILRKEKMFEQLLEVTLQSYGLSMVDKHEDVLYEKYPKQILDKYEYEILKKSEPTLGRKVYRQVAYLIRRMGYLDNSEKRVENLLKYLRKEYKNRPAMMEELENIE